MNSKYFWDKDTSKKCEDPNNYKRCGCACVETVETKASGTGVGVCPLTTWNVYATGHTKVGTEAKVTTVAFTGFEYWESR